MGYIAAAFELVFNKLLTLTQRKSLAGGPWKRSGMNKRNEKLFKAREFAQLTGVTVRALHHYDRCRKK